jgi:hypothetical protein
MCKNSHWLAVGAICTLMFYHAELACGQPPPPPLTPTVAVSDPGGYFAGLGYPASATVNGGATLQGVGLTLTYFVGTNTTGTSLGATAPSAVGTYTVLASFPGSMNFSAASATATFTIAPATPTVVVSDPGGPFTGSAYPASATVNGKATLEGVSLTLTYYVGTGTGGTNLGSTAPATVGTYAVVASFAGSADYAAASATTTFTIAPVLPTVVVTDAGGNHNGSTYPASATVNGGSTLEGVGLTLTYYVGMGTGGENLGATAPSTAGIYTVVAFFPSSADYAPNSASATFTIGVVVPTVVVTDAGGTYNGSPFPATATVNGVASLEGVSLILTYFVGTNTMGESMGATAPSEAGTYTVLALFPGSPDYGAALSTATFTIYSPTTITITAPPIRFPASAAVTVLVTAASGGPPTGNVTLSVDGGDDLTSAPTDGSATFDVSGLRPGHRCLYAAYAGAGLFLASSATGTQVVYPPVDELWCHCEGKLKVEMSESENPHRKQDFHYVAECEELPAMMYCPKPALKDIKWKWAMPRSKIKLNDKVATEDDYKFVRSWCPSTCLTSHSNVKFTPLKPGDWIWTEVACVKATNSETNVAISGGQIVATSFYAMSFDKGVRPTKVIIDPISSKTAVNLRSPINVIPNPAAIIIETKPDLDNVAIIEVAKIEPKDADPEFLGWTIKSVSDDGKDEDKEERAKLFTPPDEKNGHIGKTVYAYGVKEGRVPIVFGTSFAV